MHMLDLINQKDNSKEGLLKSSTLEWLRNHLGESCLRYGFVGFVIFDQKGKQVGALLDDAVGRTDLSKIGGFYFKSMRGSTVLSLPFKGEFPLPDINGNIHPNWPTMFVSTPIISEDGEVKGVLALRIRPEVQLSQILKFGRFGKSGESYMFDKSGNLMTKSRFEHQLRQMKLLKEGQTSILNIQTRIPTTASNITPENISSGSSNRPLTRMALSALEETTDEDVEGYLDYRGTSVVGAWSWLPDYQVGITSEIDKGEAYGPIQTMVKWFKGLAILLLVACLIGWAIVKRYLQSRKEALQNDKRLKTIMESLQDSIIAIDKKGKILTASYSVIDRFQYGPKELIGKNIKILMPEPYKSEHDNYLENYLRTGNAKIINMVRILEGERKDGTTFPLELRVTETIWDGQPQFTGIIRDITDLKQSEEKLKDANLLLEKRIEERTEDLKRARIKAERNSEAKSEFLSRMSHELRTPMNAILGFSQLLGTNKANPLSEHQSSQVNEIMNAGRHLLELINEVLDLASIESGKITLSPEPVCIVDLMEEVLSVVEPLADQYKIILVNEIARHHTLFVKADKVRTKQVLLNLISNAIKYNRIGGSVTISAAELDSENLQVNVQDTGMGIESDKLNKIFEPFDRLGAENSETEGTGIGMTITRKLMEVMNGSINVNSVVGEGSCFYITLPRCGPPREISKLNETNLESFQDSKRESNHERSLLYIEDNPANLRLVEEILMERPGLKFLSATQVPEGLEIARKLQPDLIILDINLPEMDGFKALKHLQNYDETYKIPVIALSANAMKKDIKKGLEAGFREYLTKPLDINQFLNSIDNYLD